MNFLPPLSGICYFLARDTHEEYPTLNLTPHGLFRSFFSAVPRSDDGRNRSQHPEITALFDGTLKAGNVFPNMASDMDIRPALKGFSYVVDEHVQQFQVRTVNHLSKSFLNWCKDYIYLRFILSQQDPEGARLPHSKRKTRQMAAEFLFAAFGEEPNAQQTELKTFLGQYPYNSALSSDPIYFVRKALVMLQFQDQYSEKPVWMSSFCPLLMKHGFFSIMFIFLPPICTRFYIARCCMS